MEIFGKIDGSSSYDKAKKRIILALVILFFALMIFAWYFLFFYEKQCRDTKCFVDAMENCRYASWIRTDDQASWLYTIKSGARSNACKIEVKLLEVKEGTIDSESLVGKEMVCTIPKGDNTLPEKDTSKCTGPLKEELQGLIIQKMHNYLLKSVGEINPDFIGI